jgi:hypothetical protein
MSCGSVECRKDAERCQVEVLKYPPEGKNRSMMEDARRFGMQGGLDEEMLIRCRATGEFDLATFWYGGR